MRQRNLVSSLSHVLRTLPTGLEPEVVSSNLDLIGFFSHPEILASVLTTTMSDKEQLAAVAAQSYPHVNHFDKIVLVGNPDPTAYRLTLHLWRPPYGEAVLREELIHEHRFNFWSAILIGTQVSQNYRIDPDGKAGTVYRRYRYVPERSRDVEFKDFYEFTGEVSLEHTDTDRKPAGHTYFLAAPRIHQVDLPRDGTVCSLVLRGPRLRDHSFIFNRRYPTNDSAFDNRMFTPDEIEERLTHIVSGITGDR